MTVKEFIESTTIYEHREILEQLLSFAYEEEAGQLDFDREIPGADFVEFFCNQINAKRGRIED